MYKWDKKVREGISHGKNGDPLAYHQMIDFWISPFVQMFASISQ